MADINPDRATYIRKWRIAARIAGIFYLLSSLFVFVIPVFPSDVDYLPWLFAVLILTTIIGMRTARLLGRNFISWALGSLFVPGIPLIILSFLEAPKPKVPRAKSNYLVYTVLLLFFVIFPVIALMGTRSSTHRAHLIAVRSAASYAERDLFKWLFALDEGKNTNIREIDTDGNGVADEHDLTNAQLKAAGVCKQYVTLQNSVFQKKSPLNPEINLWTTETAGKGQISCIQSGTTISLKAFDDKGNIIYSNILHSTTIDRGADVNAKDDEGWTALMFAADNGLADSVKLLIDKGADVNARNNTGETALMWAAFNGSVDVVKLLIEKGADVNARDNHGRTALMFAAQQGQNDRVKLLIDKGADVNVKNNYGRTALSIAVNNKQSETVKILQNAGAK